MAHLHLLGIAGSFMAGIAQLALESGHRVSGSDRAFYPPFGDAVRRLNIPLYEGYDADCRARDADCYIIGNAISRGNPLLESILTAGKPFISAPQWLYENILRERQVIAVAGTHGKTTTSALLAELLERAGKAPGFLIGGIVPSFGVSARLAPESPYFVIEADEYDSAYFDKRPKFLHYHPHTAIINNIEFDHADIYPDLAAIIRQFHYLFRSIHGNGHIIARGGDANITAALVQGSYSPVQYFAGNDESGNNAEDAAADAEDTVAEWCWHYENGQMTIYRNGAICTPPFTPPLAGAANRDNTLAAIAAAATTGVDPAQAGDLLHGFQPPLRRLQLISSSGDIRLYDDFAHHPTAIKKTIAALAEQRAARTDSNSNGSSSSGRLIAVFEPRSNTMKAGAFCDRVQWRDTLQQADIVIAVGEQEWLPEALDGSAETVHIVATATDAAQRLKETATAGDDILLMSNGDFGGLAGMIGEWLN